MIVGYGRTSSVEQVAGLEAQERDLRAAGAEKLFTEQVSAVARRDQLEAALDFIREGDVLLVTKPDRLARSVADLLAIVARLEAKHVALRILPALPPQDVHPCLSECDPHRMQPSMRDRHREPEAIQHCE